MTESTSTTSSPAVVDKVMAIPHLVSSIVNFTYGDRKSLARLMRTNKNFYKLAGPVLYHTVWIWEETIDSFFKGAFKPCHCPECNAEMKEKWGIDHENGCLTEYGKLMNQPHGYGRYTNPAPRPPPEPATPPKAAKAANSNKNKGKNAKKSKKYRKGKKPNNSDNAAAAADRTPDASPSKSSAASSPGPKTPGGAEEEPDIQLPISKKDLLGYVRVFTLGGHHESGCDIYSPFVADFMKNVEVLRIVETPSNAFQTFHICENIPGGSCPIVDALNPRKIVVRNVSGSQIPFPALWKLAERTKEIVFVLPTEHQCYSGKLGGGPQGLCDSLMGQFNEAKLIKVVYWDGWDNPLETHPLARRTMTKKETDALAQHLGQPLFVDDVAHILNGFTRTRRTKLWEMHRPRVEIYGLGAVKLSTYNTSRLVEAYKKENGGKAPNLHELAKRHTMRIEIGMAVAKESGQAVTIGTCTDIKWFTIDNYKRKKFAREITEWD